MNLLQALTRILVESDNLPTDVWLAIGSVNRKLRFPNGISISRSMLSPNPFWKVYFQLDR